MYTHVKQRLVSHRDIYGMMFNGRRSTKEAQVVKWLHCFGTWYCDRVEGTWKSIK